MMKKIFLLVSFCAFSMFAQAAPSDSKAPEEARNKKPIPPLKEENIFDLEKEGEAKKEEIASNNPLEELEEYSDVLPISFLFAWSFNSFSKRPNKKYKLGWFGSNKIDASLFYDMRLGKSAFFVSPGVGFSWESYDFTNSYGVTRNEGDRKIKLTKGGEVIKGLLQKSNREKSKNKVNATKLYVRYMNALVEFRAHRHPKNYKNDFYGALGFRLGGRIGAHNVVKYRADKQDKQIRHYDSFGLQRVRCDLYVRAGVNRFGILATFALKNLVDKEEWEKENKKPLKLYPWSIGLSFDFF